tara:strand:+ start:34 stop:474 length:441 start_codon:yes stop_codon:yes gene_type:complete
MVILRRPSSFSPSFCLSQKPLLIAVVNVGLAKASRRRLLRVLAERRHQDDDFDVFLNDDDDSDDDDAMEKFALKLRSMWCRLILSLSRANVCIYKKKEREGKARSRFSLFLSLSLSLLLSRKEFRDVTILRMTSLSKNTHHQFKVS